MILANVETFEGLDSYTLLSNLKDFAITCGWSVTYYYTEVGWNAVSGYYSLARASGGADVLEIASTGFGSQNLRFRFSTKGGFTDPLASWFWYAGTLQTSYNTGVGQPDPVEQEMIPYYARGTIPSLSEKVWMFGNEKFICFFMQASSSKVQNIGFGTFDLFDTSSNELIYNGLFFLGGTNPSWVNGQMTDFFDSFNTAASYQNCHFDAAKRSAITNIKAGSSTSTTVAWNGDHFWGYRHGIENEAAELGLARPLIKPLVYCIDSSAVYRPIGTLPVYRGIKPLDMRNGEIVTNGTKEFYMFSPLATNKGLNGVAIRTA